VSLQRKRVPSQTPHLSDVVPFPRLEFSVAVPLPETEFSDDIVDFVGLEKQYNTRGARTHDLQIIDP